MEEGSLCRFKQSRVSRMPFRSSLKGTRSKVVSGNLPVPGRPVPPARSSDGTARHPATDMEGQHESIWVRSVVRWDAYHALRTLRGKMKSRENRRLD